MAVVVATIAASVPLAVRTQSIAHRTADLRRLNTVITDWLTPVPSLEVVDVRIDGQAVLIRLEGPDAPPDVASLDASVQQTLGAGHNLDVQWTQRNHAVAGDRNTDQLPTVAELQPLIEAWLATSSTPASIQSVERDKKRLVVEVNGTLPPPPAGVLADELQSRLGFPVDVVVRWNRTAALDTKSLAEAAVRSWLIARPDVTLLDVEVRATGVTVTLAGPQAPPDVADLTDLIHTALGSSVDLSVQLVPVTVLPTTTVPG